MLKAVILDIDNTLYSYDEAHAAAYHALTAYAQKRLSMPPKAFDELHRLGSTLLEEHSGGRCAAIHNRLIRYQLMLEHSRLPIAHAPVMAELYWTTLLDAMKPFPGVVTALRTIRDRGLMLGIGTNMTADRQFEKLQRLGILELIDFMVTSEEVSAEKPDRRLFDCCAMKAGCRPEECIFVGDSLRGDVQGALDAGMEAIWFHPGPDNPEMPPGARRIRSFEALPDLI